MSRKFDKIVLFLGNREIAFDSYSEIRKLHQTFFKNGISLREIEKIEGNV
jgi:hypothetical protein